MPSPVWRSPMAIWLYCYLVLVIVAPTVVAKIVLLVICAAILAIDRRLGRPSRQIRET